MQGGKGVLIGVIVFMVLIALCCCAMSMSLLFNGTGIKSCACKGNFAKTKIGSNLASAEYTKADTPQTLSECQALCTNSNCDWISWSPTDCLIINGTNGIGYSYIKTADCPFEANNTSARDNINTTLKQTNTTSAAECRKQCDDNSKCEVAYWDGSACTLKAGNDDGVRTAYVNVGKMCSH